MFQIRAEAPGDGAAIEVLLDEAFGIRRHTKISYRYRIGRPPVDALSFVAVEGPILVGSIRYWTVRLDGRPALLLGPLAIELHLRGVGIGRALVRQTLARAADLGYRHVFLVGDPAYYCRFGFAPAPAGIVMPGEDPARLQWLPLPGPEPPGAGGLLLRDGQQAGSSEAEDERPASRGFVGGTRSRDGSSRPGGECGAGALAVRVRLGVPRHASDGDARGAVVSSG